MFRRYPRSAGIDELVLPQEKPENTAVYALSERNVHQEIEGPNPDYEYYKSYTGEYLTRFRGTLSPQTKRKPYRAIVQEVKAISIDPIRFRQTGTGMSIRTSEDSTVSENLPQALPEIDEELAAFVKTKRFEHNPYADTATLHAIELLQARFPDDIAALLAAAQERPYGPLSLSLEANRAMQMVRSVGEQLRFLVQDVRKPRMPIHIPEYSNVL